MENKMIKYLKIFKSLREYGIIKLSLSSLFTPSSITWSNSLVANAPGATELTSILAISNIVFQFLK